MNCNILSKLTIIKLSIIVAAALIIFTPTLSPAFADSTDCAEDEIWDSQADSCILDKQDCLGEEIWDSQTGSCVLADCQDGYEVNRTTDQCEPIICPFPQEMDHTTFICFTPSAPTCSEGTMFNPNTNTCVPDITFNTWINDGTNIYHTNNGVDWESSTTDSPYVDVSFLDENNVFIVSSSEPSILQYTSNGLTTDISTLDGGTQFYKIKFVDENTGWAILTDDSGGDFDLFKTTDGGVNWEYTSVRSVKQISFLDENNGWLVDDNNVIHHTNDGVSFSQINSNFNGSVYNINIMFVDKNNGWLIDGSNLHKTTNGGKDWGGDVVPQCNGIIDLFFIDEYTGWIVERDVILYTDDGGHTFTKNQLFTFTPDAFFYGFVVNTFTSDNIDATIPIEETKSGGSGNEWLTRPTFGLNHKTQSQLVDDGFRFNGRPHTITDNWHTDFAIQNVTLGEQNTFKAKVYAEKGLYIQEFIFGIPEVGSADTAELRIEAWYGYDGVIEDIIIVQDTDIIYEDSVGIGSDKVLCQLTDVTPNCYQTTLFVSFLEPLQYDVMAIKAIDFERRATTTYLNDGFNISGISLNPMIVKSIPGPEKYEGFITVTQTAKYSDLWVSEDGREFTMNDYGSFKQAPADFKRFVDSGDPRTRLHSAFTEAILNEQQKAQEIINTYYKPIESVSRDSIVNSIVDNIPK